MAGLAKRPQFRSKPRRGSAVDKSWEIGMGFLGLAAAAALAAAPASDAHAMELMAQLKAATGGAALDRPRAFRERGTMTRDGRQGSYETFGDLMGMRSSSSQSFGGASMRGGYDGHVSWHVGPDGAGKAVNDEAVLKGERLGTYMTVSGYLYPERFPASFSDLGRKQADGKSFDVVMVTPRDASSAELWLDAGTHRLARVKMADGPAVAEGEVGDWREVDGTWIGYALTIREAGHEVRLQLTDFQYVPAEEALFTSPVR
jgi:hypothetical protein